MGTTPGNRSYNTGSGSPNERGSDEAYEQASTDKLLRKVLLVDDETDGAEFAAELLRGNGLKVLVAHSAHQALQVLHDDGEIDAVVADVMMPRMNGFELAEAIRVMYPAVKVVLMSGYVMPELREGREHHYLFAEKPCRIDTIIRLLRS
jgi:CheY-like chemotaxis protein